MILQFQTADDAVFVADVVNLQWARVSAPPVPGDDAASVVVENGKLVPQGFGIYAFEGRDLNAVGTGGDLRTIGTYIVGTGQTITIFVRANVIVKNFTMPAPITQIRYEILPDDPQQIQHMIEEVPDAPAPLPYVDESSEFVEAPDADSGNTDSDSNSGGDIPNILVEDSRPQAGTEDPGTPANDDPFAERTERSFD